MPNLLQKIGFKGSRSLRGTAKAPLDDRPTRTQRYLTRLWLWLGVPTMLLLPGGLGLWAVAQLFGLPDLPKCLTVSWSDSWSEDNPATRLYCGEIAANRRTPQDLQTALQLISHIPRDHPLYAEADRMTQKWSADILQLGEEAYQEGNLQEAIAIAERVPQNVRTHSLVVDRIQKWQDTWHQAETIYEEAQSKIQDKNWYGVIVSAKLLLGLGNRYWATTQHQELMRNLQVAKEGEEKQVLAAAQQTRKSSSNSARDLLSRMNQAQVAEAKAHLNQARSLAKSGDAEALQSAIGQAQQVIFGTDGYEEAQQMISSWRRQIEVLDDQPRLDRAKALANQGDIDSLQAAIVEANQIGWGRALYDEANGQVEQWRDRLFELETAARTQQLDQMTRGGTAETREPERESAIDAYQPVSLPTQPDLPAIERDRSLAVPTQQATQDPVISAPPLQPSASP
ncbi:MAG: hypothetical protein HY785_16765 [Oscillatoriophycideae cyanobacterium NC_groundwater_1537_Pr4_S-0.65um_50_18]|nr:hypothetical protein [Oscillatoriophycideae cyanobacterium NC_groundwater_1537_Pr4_S-0.65um_50_18]